VKFERPVLAIAAVLLVSSLALAQQAPPPPETTKQETEPSQPAPAPTEQPAQPAAADAAQAPAAPPVLSEAGEAALTSAKVAFKAGQWQDALDASLKVLAEQAGNWDALYMAGACERQLNQWDAAEGHLKTLAADSPNYPFANFQLGYVEFVQADAAARNGNEEEAKAKYSDAADAFAKELARNPNQAAVVSSEAIALARAGRIDESVKVHDTWIGLAPDKNEPIVSLAATYALADRSTEAMAALDRLPQKDPKASFDAAMAIATVFVAKKHWDAAVPFLEKATAIDPTSTQARAGLTEAYARALQYDDAANSLKTLMTMDPSPEEAGAAGDAIRATIGDGKVSVSIPGVEPPAILKVPAPRYPKGQDTSVQTEILVLTRIAPPKNVVETIMVPNRIWKDMRASGFEAEAIEAVKRGKYIAGTKNGQPADLWTVVPVKFSGSN
jgi:tetratricopeptide (TPR) repeat protein